MKLNLTRTLLAVAACAMLYTSCKKESKPVTTTTSTIDYKNLSSQVAMAFYKSITGQYGGTDVTKGITLPSNINVASHAGLRLNSTNSLCGFIVDTTYNTKATVGDTAKTFWGNFHFTYTCSTTTPDGYAVHDSLVNTEVGPTFNNTFMVAQDYVVKALDQTYKVVSMNGTIKNSIQDFIKDPAHPLATTGFFTLATNYKLTGLVVNFSTGVADVTTGTATFTTFGYREDSTTPIDG